jgi:hypothetical protein
MSFMLPALQAKSSFVTNCRRPLASHRAHRRQPSLVRPRKPAQRQILRPSAWRDLCRLRPPRRGSVAQARPTRRQHGLDQVAQARLSGLRVEELEDDALCSPARSRGVHSGLILLRCLVRANVVSVNTAVTTWSQRLLFLAAINTMRLSTRFPWTVMPSPRCKSRRP